MNEKQIIKLLQSGNFSIVYTDNDECQIYRGREVDLDDLNNDFVAEYNGSEIGYVPTVVEILVKALGGNSESY